VSAVGINMKYLFNVARDIIWLSIISFEIRNNSIAGNDDIYKLFWYQKKISIGCNLWRSGKSDSFLMETDDKSDNDNYYNLIMMMMKYRRMMMKWLKLFRHGGF